MRLPLPRSLPTIAILAVALGVASAGGAVAGSMITGAQIQNNTVTGLDIKDKSLTSKDVAPLTARRFSGVAGYKIVTRHLDLPDSTPGSVSADCTAGTVLIGGSAFWQNDNAAAQMVPFQNGGGAIAYTDGVGGDDTLYIRIMCARKA